MTEQYYIRYRKLKAFGNRICFYLCRIFPIKNNLISVCTFEGKGGFGCNPKYIVQELHKRNPEYEFVWFLNKDVQDKEFPDYIKKVPNTLWSRAYWLSRSKVWIDNYRKPYGTCKRKGQYYLNTWHGMMGFKSIGLWRGNAFSKMAYLVSENDSKMIDNVCIDSVFSEFYFRKGMVYEGEFLKVGQARCDILHNERGNIRLDYRIKHHLPEDAKIIMFAPTFREGANAGKRIVFSELWSIDFERLLLNLEKRFGGTWYLCIRVHPQLAMNWREYSEEKLKGKIIDASSNDDMYEVLAAVDAYVTDYSSAAFEAAYTEMPVFIYADDIKKYTEDRGSLVWELSEDTDREVHNNPFMAPGLDIILPFAIAKNNDELEDRILEFNEERYRLGIRKMKSDIGLIYDGQSSSKIADRIELNIMKDRK